MIIEEFYDAENPRFELELFGESFYAIKYSIVEKPIKDVPIDYQPPSNKKASILKKSNKPTQEISELSCSVCNKSISKENSVSANNGKMLICRDCFKKLF